MSGEFTKPYRRHFTIFHVIRLTAFLALFITIAIAPLPEHPWWLLWSIPLGWIAAFFVVHGLYRQIRNAVAAFVPMPLLLRQIDVRDAVLPALKRCVCETPAPSELHRQVVQCSACRGVIIFGGE